MGVRNIFIPTRGRPYRQPTFNALWNAGERPKLFCSVDDPSLKHYVEIFGDAVHVSNAETLVQKRQKIVNYARRHNIDRIVMMDDDLTFFARQKDGKFKKATSKDIVMMVSMIYALLTKHAHVGLVDKFMSQNRPRGVVNSGRYNQVLGYNLSMWPEGVMFRAPLNQEHDVHLQLSIRGLPPTILCEYSKDARYYAEGGLSFFRTPEVERAAHEWFVNEWGDYAKLVPKKTPCGVGIQVNWKKVDGASS